MRICLIVIALFISMSGFAQKNKKFTRKEYIEEYKGLAMEEMKRTGIPASITLAQGILESGDGNSTLATKANNHFGIKCHDWTGPSVKQDDDAKNECFRKYRSPEQSYLDHSDFLTGRTRYAPLFELKPNDYKAWSKGLKKAGYATSRTYASALIGIIEDNKLYEYDTYVLASGKKGKNHSSNSMIANRPIIYINRVKCIVADSNDTYASLTKEMSMFDWQIPKYNEVSMSDRLEVGEYVYIQPKRSRVSGKLKSHMVASGETVHAISQKYGIKEIKLRQRNNIPDNAEPAQGVVLLLKGKLNSNAIPSLVNNSIEKLEQKKEEESKPEFEIEYDLGG